MTTHIPRDSYSQEELAKLYPKELELQLVQILLRHGERTPVSPRFQNTGLQPYWPYCNAARQLSSVIMSTQDFTRWDQLKYRRRIETFGVDDGPVIASGPSNESDAVCQPGELTDKGRQTTLALGQRLRHLYVDQLQFMPQLIADSDSIYLRATPIPRALESVQQAFWGFYPPSTRTADFPPPTIITRTPADETLFPNDASCRRFGQLSRAFAQRSAERWNDSDDMQYLSSLFSKYMPDQAKVAVDSRPRISGIMDTINATDAHGPATKLPKAFYDPRARAIIDKIAVEEWFSGYAESAEYRMLGIGALLGDVAARMAGSIEGRGRDGLLEIGGAEGGRGGETKIKLALSGCHDTTLAAALSSLGAFEGEKWPPFTSHVAFELFRKKSGGETDAAYTPPTRPATPTLNTSAPPAAGTWWSSLFGRASSPSTPSSPSTSPPDGIGRKPLSSLTPAQRASLDGYYVRVRYNDRIMQIPACQAAGKHLEGDTSLCTLETFKGVVDQFTPKSWKAACSSRLDEPAFPERKEPAGLE